MQGQIAAIEAEADSPDTEDQVLNEDLLRLYICEILSLEPIRRSN